MKYNESLSIKGPRCDHTSALKTYEPTVYHQTTRSTSAARAVPLGSWDSARYPPRSTARKMPSPASAAAGARCLGCFCDLQRTDQKCSKYLQILSSMIQMVQIQNGPSICMKQTLEHGWTRPDTLCWSLECRKPSSATRRSGAILEASDFSWNSMKQYATVAMISCNDQSRSVSCHRTVTSGVITKPSCPPQVQSVRNVRNLRNVQLLTSGRCFKITVQMALRRSKILSCWRSKWSSCSGNWYVWYVWYVRPGRPGLKKGPHPDISWLNQLNQSWSDVGILKLV